MSLTVEHPPTDAGGASRHEGAALLAALGVTVAVHGVALTSDFADEDLRHIFESQKLELFPYLVRPYGNHFCASFRLAVIALYGLFGDQAAGYFALMLLTHVLNVALVYGIQRNFGAPAFTAALAAGLWGSAPAFQGSLQWFAAYSHVMGAAAALFAFWELSRAARDRRPPTAWALVRMGVILFLGAGTEMTGTLTALLFPIIAVMVLPREASRLRTAFWLGIAAALSAFVVLKFTARANAPVLSIVTLGTTTKALALLLVHGIGMVALGPFTSLTAENVSWFFHGSVAATVMTSMVIAPPVLMLVILRLRRSQPAERLVLLAFLGLSVGVYGAIAVGRGGLIPDQLDVLATRDRYHYHAGAFLWVLMGLVVARAWPRLATPGRPISRRMVAVLAAAAVMWVASGSQAALATYRWGGGRQEWTRDWCDLVDRSILVMMENTPEGGALYVRNDTLRPANLLYAMGAPRSKLPGIAVCWITVRGASKVKGRTVRFVEWDRATLDETRVESRPEIASMFVSAEQVEQMGGVVRTIEGNVPPPVWQYIEQSADPIFAPSDHALARRLHSTLLLAAGLPPRPWAPTSAASVSPVLPPAPSPSPSGNAPNLPAADEDQLRRAIANNPDTREQMRKAFEEDPEAREELRKAILADPKAMEQLRQELERQSGEGR